MALAFLTCHAVSYLDAEYWTARDLAGGQIVSGDAIKGVIPMIISPRLTLAVISAPAHGTQSLAARHRSLLCSAA